MADITTAQLNTGKATVLNSLFVNYPAVRAPAIRIAVKFLKDGNVTEQKVAKVLLQQAYQSIHGADPVGNHDFYHWLRDRALRVMPDDPIQGIGADDAFEAITLTVG